MNYKIFYCCFTRNRLFLHERIYFWWNNTFSGFPYLLDALIPWYLSMIIDLFSHENLYLIHHFSPFHNLPTPYFTPQPMASTFGCTILHTRKTVSILILTVEIIGWFSCENWTPDLFNAINKHAFAGKTKRRLQIILQAPEIYGALDQDWTGDLILTKDALYRLSYKGMVNLNLIQQDSR